MKLSRILLGDLGTVVLWTIGIASGYTVIYWTGHIFWVLIPYTDACGVLHPMFKYVMIPCLGAMLLCVFAMLGLLAERLCSNYIKSIKRRMRDGTR